MSRVLIGVDVGTGSARAGVFDETGQLLAVAKRPIAIWREPGDAVEQSSQDIWRRTTEAVREAVAAAGVRADAVAGLGFAATCSLVALDGELAPLSLSVVDAPERDVIVWMDHRAAADAERVNAGGHAALKYFGGGMSPEMQTPKLMWLMRCKPETFARAAHFLSLTDFLSFRATGSLQRSLGPAATKFGYLAHEGRWPGEFLDSVGLGALTRDGFARLGAEIVAAGTALGAGLSPEAAAAMGLKPGTPVGAGLVDAHAGALATLGASEGGAAGDPRRRLALILGTSSTCMAVSDAPLFADSAWGPHFSALTQGQWLIDAGQSAFGAAIDRLLRMHPAFPEFSARCGARMFEEMERDIVARAGGRSQAALMADGLHVLASFIGERAPAADAAARAAVVGLDLREDLASLQELYVAGLCGLAYGLAKIVSALERAGYAFETIVVSGGASRSALVRQIVADVCGKPVAATATAEPVLLGSAMIGAAASGRRSVASAMAAMSRLGETLGPAGGAIAAFHDRKRSGFEVLWRAERDMREIARRRAWPELVIFDCDGVLVDSEPIALSVTRRMLEEAGLRLTDAETRERFLGLSLDSVLKRMDSELAAPLPRGFHEQLSDEILAAFGRELKAIEGVKQAVARLHAPVCVASSSAPARIRYSLKVTGLEPLFAPNLFSAAQVANGKPAPDLFLFAARMMNAKPPDCLVIEDSVAGITAARAAGMTAFGFVGGSHFSDPRQATQLTAAGAELIFADMAELPDIVAKRSARVSGERS